MRPGITNKALWQPDRGPDWPRVRKSILQRDDFTCQSCGHRALKWMNVHHVGDSEDPSPDNLLTVCVACHAVLHFGRNMTVVPTFEVYRAAESQVEIVRKTRALVAQGMSLKEVKKALRLTEGEYPPNALNYLIDLAKSIGTNARAELPEPLSVVFVQFKRWQIEPEL